MLNSLALLFGHEVHPKYPYFILCSLEGGSEHALKKGGTLTENRIGR